MPFGITEISYVDVMLHKIYRIVVPNGLRRIHKSHQGIENSLRTARDLVYWPEMGAELKNLIRACDTCNVYSNHQVKGK